jgi:hypothetical protein
MGYHYLKGIEKYGPYTKDELLNFNLNPDTLIYGEEFNEWTPIKNLSDYTFNLTSENTNQEKSNIKKIKISGNKILIIGFIVSVFLSFLYVQNKKKNDYESLKKEIDNIFQGKTEICDYERYTVQGKLRKSDETDARDEEDKKLYEIFELESGGFEIYQLTNKTNDKFAVTKITSSNLGYKIPAQTYNEGFWGYGYNTPTYRGEVKSIYKEAMEYLSSDNKTYERGSFDNIKNFEKISSDYFRVNFNEYNFITKGGYVFTKKWIVWYESIEKGYEIKDNWVYYFTQVLIFTIIFFVVCLCLYFLYKFQSKVQVQID